MSFRWPQDVSRQPQGSQQAGETNTPATSHVVQLLGPREQVDAAYDKLVKLIKKIRDENYEQEFRIYEDCRSRILGPTICNLLKETNTRVRYFDKEKTQGVIFGVQANVEAAIDRLDKLQRSLVCTTTLTHVY